MLTREGLQSSYEMWLQLGESIKTYNISFMFFMLFPFKWLVDDIKIYNISCCYFLEK